MQLTGAGATGAVSPASVSRGSSPLRARLRAAACLLLASGIPATARAQAEPGWLIEGAGLFYKEKDRTQVVEPVGRVTRRFANGQSISAQFAYDTITGASPNGALPSGAIQTTTTPSGRASTTGAGNVPLSSYQDERRAVDVEWAYPIVPQFTITSGGHYSKETDYLSKGVSGKASLEFNQRLTTITVGGSTSDDEIRPVGGTPVGLDSMAVTGATTNPKRVAGALVGVSQILSRRWLVGLDYSLNRERGYLTEPYKVVSLLDPAGIPSGHSVREKRPDERQRSSLLASSVYHLTRDVFHASYRYYWDDWGVRSHTADVKYRMELGGGAFWQPRARIYTQTRADFFTWGLNPAGPMPRHATSDYRLGSLRTLTLGATYGFQPHGIPGEVMVRGEYIRQWIVNLPRSGIAGSGGGGGEDEGGEGREGDRATGLAAPIHIGSLLIGYSISF